MEAGEGERPQRSQAYTEDVGYWLVRLARAEDQVECELIDLRQALGE